MRRKRVWIVALAAGVAVGAVSQLIVWKRTWHASFALRAGSANHAVEDCRVFEYDHVAMLTAIDEADKDAVDALTLLRRSDPQPQPLRAEKITYLEAKRQHLALLADLVTRYFRGGHVDNRQCFGDVFLERYMHYPSFGEAATQKRIAQWKIEQEKRKLEPDKNRESAVRTSPEISMRSPTENGR